MKNIYILLFYTMCFVNANAATKTSIGTGDWNNASIWSPAGVPTKTDDVNISNGHSIFINGTPYSCTSLTILNGATLTVSTGSALNLSGIKGLVVYGSCIVNGGINFLTSGSTFSIGSTGSFIWNPDNNTASGATIWTKGLETFSPTSTTTIKKWYSMTTPLGAVVTGNFGNLTIDYSTTGKWYQNNYFQTHSILGDLTINRGYIVFDNTNAITNTTVGSIVLNGSQAHLNFYEGTRSGTFTVNTSKIILTSGELNFYMNSGTGNCIVNVSGDVLLGNSGLLKCNNLHNGTSTLNITGNFTNNGGSYFGVYKGNGDNTVNIKGNLYNLYQTWHADFYSIVDGNGNATLTIAGDLTNNCYMDLIWNSGVSGVGNGNGTMTVSGTYFQSAGDFRAVYNLSTYNAGSINLNFNDVSFTGGIFMAYYACSSTPNANSMIVKGNLTINFSSPTNIFRLNGLATLASTNSTSPLTLAVGGDLMISGNNQAEFTSSCSSGNENIFVNGNSTFSGGTNYFQRTAHTSRFANSGDFTVKGGTTYLAYSSENAMATIRGNYNQSGNSNFVVKGNNGSCTLTVNGNFNLENGNFYQHSNTTNVSNDVATTNIYGTYNQSGGTFWFDDNSSSVAQNTINIYGGSFTLANNCILKCQGSNASNYPGVINFYNNGITNYNRSNGNQTLSFIKQCIKKGATLELNSNLLISSHDAPKNDNLIIEQGGILNLNSFQTLPSGNQPYSGITVKDGGRVQLKNGAGLWNNANTAALSSSLDYNLEPNSVIEYNGGADQIITGYRYGSEGASNKKYGILEINLSAITSRAYLTDSAFVRSRLQLSNGQLDLNNNLLTIESGKADAINRINGYLKSETFTTTNNAELKWCNLSAGTHIFPFGFSNSEYLPVSFTPTLGIGNTVSVSTRAASKANNIPFATYVNNYQGDVADASASSVINRWWTIKANGITADITFSYRGIENKVRTNNAASTLSIQSWTGSSWSTPFGSAKGATSGIGTISASGVSFFGDMVVSSSEKTLPSESIRFTAEPKEEIVDLKWAASNAAKTDYFNIERSSDGITFEIIKKLEAAGNRKDESLYHTIDVIPLPGKSYYRVKKIDTDRTFSYSDVRTVNRKEKSSQENTMIDINNIMPNPFIERFAITYNLKKASKVNLQLLNMNGEIIHQETLQALSGINYYDFNNNNKLPSGQYIVSIVCGNDKASKKIIKSSI